MSEDGAQGGPPEPDLVLGAQLQLLLTDPSWVNRG